QIFQVQIEFSELALRVQPRLLSPPVLELLLVDGPLGEHLRPVIGTLPEQSAVGQNGPKASPARLPAVEILPIEQILPLLGVRRQGESKHQHRECAPKKHTCNDIILSVQ